MVGATTAVIAANSAVIASSGSNSVESDLTPLQQNCVASFLYILFGIMSVLLWRMISDTVDDSVLLRILCFIAWSVMIPLAFVVFLFMVIFGEI